MKQKVVITVNSEYINQLTEVRANLEQKGLHVDNVFEFGVITGEVETKKISALEQLPEVEQISPDQEIQLPPPDAPIQ